MKQTSAERAWVIIREDAAVLENRLAREWPLWAALPVLTVARVAIGFVHIVGLAILLTLTVTLIGPAICVIVGRIVKYAVSVWRVRRGLDDRVELADIE